MMARKSKIEARLPRLLAMAGGHLCSYVTSQPESEERGGVYTLDTSGTRLVSGTGGRNDL